MLGVNKRKFITQTIEEIIIWQVKILKKHGMMTRAL